MENLAPLYKITFRHKTNRVHSHVTENVQRTLETNYWMSGNCKNPAYHITGFMVEVLP